ncbi:hypothetical protein M758_3G102800 [Ceratodon purpureus]|nr:hypothetical protein M758_3G102800 [Ceratodon purpureus]
MATIATENFTQPTFHGQVEGEASMGMDLAISTQVLLTCIAGFLVWHVLKYSRIKGPIVWPVLGTTPQFLWNLPRMHDWTTDMLVKHDGTYTSIAPKCTCLTAVATCRPENLEYVLKTNFANYPKGRSFTYPSHDLLGQGIFNTDHDLWKMQRKTASLEFSTRTLRDLMVKSNRSSVQQRLLPTLAEVAASREPIDFQDLFLRYTFDNICMVGFGVDPGCLAPGLPTVPFAQAFDLATEGTLTRMVVPEIFWRITRYFGIGMEGRLAKAIDVIDKFATDVITERRKELALLKLQNATDYPCDLLSRFMQTTDHQGNPYTDKFLRDVTTNFILAGRDTTAIALSWFFYLITQHPDVEQKILHEIETILNLRTDPELHPEGSLGFEELKQLNYLHAALSESMRLYPSVPIDNKDVTADDFLPDGTFVRKGTRLMYSIYSMGRMESIWGKDCLDFKPERWLRSGVFTPESPFKYTVFNAGPRLCLGKELAYLQMKSVASAILRNYHVHLVEGHKVEYKLSLTLFMKFGLRVTLHPRVNVVY